MEGIIVELQDSNEHFEDVLLDATVTYKDKTEEIIELKKEKVELQCRMEELLQSLGETCELNVRDRTRFLEELKMLRSQFETLLESVKMCNHGTHAIPRQHKTETTTPRDVTLDHEFSLLQKQMAAVRIAVTKSISLWREELQVCMSHFFTNQICLVFVLR